MAEVTIIVDGRKIKAGSGSLLIDVCKRAGIEIPSFLLPRPLSPGRLPHVSGRDRENAKVADGMYNSRG